MIDVFQKMPVLVMGLAYWFYCYPFPSVFLFLKIYWHAVKVLNNFFLIGIKKYVVGLIIKTSSDPTCVEVRAFLEIIVRA